MLKVNDKVNPIGPNDDAIQRGTIKAITTGTEADGRFWAGKQIAWVQWPGQEFMSCWPLDELKKWNERTYPSVDALKWETEADALAEKIGGKSIGVVWLTDDGEGYFDACEGVVITGYLGKYDLIRF